MSDVRRWMNGSFGLNCELQNEQQLSIPQRDAYARLMKGASLKKEFGLQALDNRAEDAE